MKRFTIWLTLGAGLIWAQDGGGACKNDTLKGAYALSISGTRPAPVVLPALPSFLVGSTETVIGVFVQVFDGKGAFFHTDNVAVKGSISGMYPDKPGKGTYQVNADCTGTFIVQLPQIPFPLVNSMVIYDNGKRFRSVVVSPQALMIEVSGERI